MNTDGAELVAVADLSEERGTKAVEEYGVKWYADYKEMLQRDDIDVVVVAVPSGLHAAVGIEVAKAGKHVLSEKPLDISVERGHEFIAACKEAGVKLAVNFQNRFAADVRRTKTLIEEGRLGRLLLAEARLKWFRTQEYYDAGGWRGTWKMDGGGALMNQSVHFIDLLQWIAGRATTVVGHWEAINHKIETEDLGMGIVKFENGATGTILGTTVVKPSMGTEMCFHGTEGSIVLKDNEVQVIAIDGIEDAKAYFDSIPLTGTNSSIEDMVEVVRTGREPWINGEDGLHAVEIITGIYESANAGSPFDLRSRKTVSSLIERTS